ncbi:MULTISPECIES: 30S ribosome-binding factor RbfA [Clostridium]|uniref:Ribosome-binding factor A n=1 Tax=Clostridium paridis TaxID=2803863 RepID=A0A937K2Q5_9CLOT|nr:MULTISPECIES: 30S ribosome-binding factor RbfA [Clostridium]MBL4930882.1 30S ribosome-binding factor RbfA [Clostridium paridis]MDD7793797.1 30S ribosome-binding factor RbfA [Clostridium sp. 'White wine YQ']
MANYRGGRINEEVKKIISSLIQYEIKDPRMSAMVSVTDVNVTKDLRYAKVFVSIFTNNEEEKKATLQALKSASGFIRRELGHKINLRYTPEVLFEEDSSISNGMYIDSLIEKIKEK